MGRSGSHSLGYPVCFFSISGLETWRAVAVTFTMICCDGYDQSFELD
jgi:hypothetical protein